LIENGKKRETTSRSGLSSKKRGKKRVQKGVIGFRLKLKSITGKGGSGCGRFDIKKVRRKAGGVRLRHIPFRKA